jgi:formylglycine-generating enzyme required for sulfatase activity
MSKPWSTFCRCFLLAWAATVVLQSQEDVPCDRPPLVESELAQLIAAGVPDLRLEQFISHCGLSLPGGEREFDRRLKQLGASDSLVARLKPAAAPKAGQVWKSPIDQREMVWMPPGTFSMGSPETEPGRDADEPQHQVTIAQGFWLETAEVTNDAYRRFLRVHPEWQKTNISRDRHDGNYLREWSADTYPATKADFPVTSVTWEAASGYALWAGKRLPTEAEWEYAGRAGSTDAYWWGPAFDSRRANNGPTLVIAGVATRRNPWGLSDMLGNVWEWTSSLDVPYPYRADDRENPASPGARIMRGGAAPGAATFLRVANRNRLDARASSPLVGFRCAR